MRQRRLGSAKTKVILGAAVLALCLAPAASAKFKLWLTVGDSTPRVGQATTVVLHSERDLDYDLKLIAVGQDDPVAGMLAAFAGEVDKGLEPPASPFAEMSVPREIPVSRTHRIGTRTVVSLGVAGVILSAGTVAAAVTGDPLAPIRKVVTVVTEPGRDQPKADRQEIASALQQAEDAIDEKDPRKAQQMLAEAKEKAKSANGAAAAEAQEWVEELEPQLQQLQQNPAGTPTGQLPGTATSAPATPAETLPNVPADQLSEKEKRKDERRKAREERKKKRQEEKAKKTPPPSDGGGRQIPTTPPAEPPAGSASNPSSGISSSSTTTGASTAGAPRTTGTDSATTTRTSGATGTAGIPAPPG